MNSARRRGPIHGDLINIPKIIAIAALAMSAVVAAAAEPRPYTQ
jgi:hypothetical protein